jgi:hypothetical protein
VLAALLQLVRHPTMPVQVFTKHVVPTALLSEKEVLQMYTYFSFKSERDRRRVFVPFKIAPRGGHYIITDSTVFCKEHRRSLEELLGSQFADADFKLVHRGTRDTFTNASFHSHCDKIGATLIVCRSTTGYIFGGFTETAWHKGNSYKPGKSWLFSFGSAHNKKCTRIVKLRNTQDSNMVYGSSSYGAWFGSGPDMRIHNKSVSCNTKSYKYYYPGFPLKTGVSSSTLMGSSTCTLAEIEVYQVTGVKL